MEYPKRKANRLKDYDYSQNGLYFVTVCTYERQCLFEKSIVGNDLCVVPSDITQNIIIEKWLSKLENKFGITIEKYVIMPDHIHFILFIDAMKTCENDNMQEVQLESVIPTFTELNGLNSTWLLKLKTKAMKFFAIRRINQWRLLSIS